MNKFTLFIIMLFVIMITIAVYALHTLATINPLCAIGAILVYPGIPIAQGIVETVKQHK